MCMGNNMFDARTFVMPGFERDDGNWSADSGKQIVMIKHNHPELSEWGDLAVGCAWLNYSEQFFDVSWCDWMADKRDDLFLCYCYYRQEHGYWHFGFSEEKLSQYNGWKSIKDKK